MAKSKVKFVSSEFIKENTTIQDNVDDDIIVPYIYKVQDRYLQQSLGTTFYEHLKLAIINQTLTNDEDDLIRDYIQPMITEYVVYELLPHINYKLTNKAVSTQNSEYSNPSSLDEVKYLRYSVRDMADFYLKRLNKFLCDYGTLFPTYVNPSSPENLSKSYKSYFNGIFLPKRNTWSNLPTDPGYNNCTDC